MHLCIGGFIGNLPTEQHQVSGKFYIVDSKTIFIEDFNYDGGGPGKTRAYQATILIGSRNDLVSIF